MPEPQPTKLESESDCATEIESEVESETGSDTSTDDRPTVRRVGTIQDARWRHCCRQMLSAHISMSTVHHPPGVY